MRGRDARVLGGLAGLALMLAGCGERELILTGERFDPRAPLDASIPVEGEAPPVDTTGRMENRALPVSLPPVQASPEWTHRGGNARHVAPHAALSAAPQRVWSASLGQGNTRRTRIVAQPVAGGGLVFGMDAGARVSAFTPAGGTAWAVDLRPTSDASQISGGGLAYGAGRVLASTGYGELVALDPANGAVVWRQRLGAPAAGAPMVEDNIAYVVARDSSAWAIDIRNGRIVWELPGTPSPSGMIGSGSPAAAGARVLFPFPSGELVAAERASGLRVWQAVIAGQRRGRAYAGLTEITSDPVVAGNVTYVGNASGRTVALDTATGGRLWSAREGAYGPVLP
ncbi:MAG TPA: PQQ-like beta-propeller repeat protein, partial [Paracoccaceae bacterium]|nr:PQQ-like beta-propeller repeat protein [Paracoccaceae bacterium]